MPLAPPVAILVWAHAAEHGREVGITCDLLDLANGVFAYHATATSGVAYRLSDEDAAALLRIITPASDALAHPPSLLLPHQSPASD